jgi:hypothetical protein
MKRIAKGGMKDDTITRWLRIDSRGRFQLKEEDRLCLGLKGGEMLEVTIKRAKIPED